MERKMLSMKGVWEATGAGGGLEHDPQQIVGLFQVIAENINSVFWARDLGANRLLYISPAFDRIWGFPRQRLYAHPEAWQEAVHPDDLPRVRRLHTRRFAGEGGLEYRVMRPDGGYCWVRSRIFLVQDDLGRVRHEVGIAEDITESRRLLEQLQRSRQRYRRLVEEEQKRIARDLHDEFGQLLPLLRGRVEQLQNSEKLVGAEVVGGKTACTSMGEAFEQQGEGGGRMIGELLDIMGRTVRRTINRLRPDILDKMGLGASIEQKMGELSRCYPGIKVSFSELGRPVPLSSEQEVELYRVCQEGLNNIYRHADARRITVRLIHSFPDLILEINDDGRGFDPDLALEQSADERGGLGLHSMRERMEALGGVLRITSAPGEGCKIRAELAINHPAGVEMGFSNGWIVR